MNTEITNETPGSAVNHNTTSLQTTQNNRAPSLTEALFNIRQSISEGIESQTRRFSREGLSRLKDFLFAGTMGLTMVLGAIKVYQNHKSDSEEANMKMTKWTWAISVPFLFALSYLRNKRLRENRRQENATVTDSPSLHTTGDLELGVIGRQSTLSNPALDRLAAIPNLTSRSNSLHEVSLPALPKRLSRQRSLSFP